MPWLWGGGVATTGHGRGGGGGSDASALLSQKQQAADCAQAAGVNVFIKSRRHLKQAIELTYHFLEWDVGHHHPNLVLMIIATAP